MRLERTLLAQQVIWRRFNVFWTSWTSDERQNNVVCLLGRENGGYILITLSPCLFLLCNTYQTYEREIEKGCYEHNAKTSFAFSTPENVNIHRRKSQPARHFDVFKKRIASGNVEHNRTGGFKMLKVLKKKNIFKYFFRHISLTDRLWSW